MPKIKRKCEYCGKEFQVWPCRLKEGQGKYCSLKCRNLAYQKKMKRKCKYCGKEFYEVPSQIKLGHGTYCSKSCSGHAQKGVLSRGLPGKMNPNWKGGVAKNADGRILIKCPDHPCSHKSSGYVLRYRLVMEKHIGRTLLPTEVVHHINGIVDDDRIENLMLFSSQGEHQKINKKGF